MSRKVQCLFSRIKFRMKIMVGCLQIPSGHGFSQDMDDRQHFDSLCEDCGVPGTAPEPQTSVTIGLHEVKTALKKSKKGLHIRNTVETDVFAILAKGNGSSLDWPHSFKYKDPLISWTSKIITAHDQPKLLKKVDQTWEKEVKKPGCSGDDLPNPYTIFHKTHNGQVVPLPTKPTNENDINRFESLPMEPSKEKDIIRLGRKLVLDIKTRKPDQKSVVHHLKQNSQYVKEYSTLLNQNHLKEGDTVQASPHFKQFYSKLCTELPVSYQYPTISIMNTLLPRPNNMCAVPPSSPSTQSVDGDGDCEDHACAKEEIPQLVNSFDNHAHIRFCDESYAPYIPSEKEVIKIMKAHIVPAASCNLENDSNEPRPNTTPHIPKRRAN